MILLIVILSVAAFAIINVFAKNALQTFCSLIFGAIFVISTGFMMANLTYHFGMEKVTKTTTTALVSSGDSDSADILLYQPLGNGSEKVYLYKTDSKQKKPKQTGTDSVKNSVVTGAETAQKVTKTTTWVYKSDAYKLLFNIADNNHQYVKRSNTFEIPDSWVQLSVAQAKKLAQLVADNKAQMTTDAKAYVQEKMTAALTADPTMDAAAQKAASEKFAAEFQQQAFAKLVAQAKAD